MVGITASEIDVSELTTRYVNGFALNRDGGVRGAIEALQAAYFFDVQERDGKIYFERRGSGELGWNRRGSVGNPISRSRRSREASRGT